MQIKMSSVSSNPSNSMSIGDASHVVYSGIGEVETSSKCYYMYMYIIALVDSTWPVASADQSNNTVVYLEDTEVRVSLNDGNAISRRVYELMVVEDTSCRVD